MLENSNLHYTGCPGPTVKFFRSVEDENLFAENAEAIIIFE